MADEHKSLLVNKLAFDSRAQVYFAETFLNSREQDEMLQFVRSLKQSDAMTETYRTSIHQTQHYWKAFFGDKGAYLLTAWM